VIIGYHSEGFSYLQNTAIVDHSPRQTCCVASIMQSWTQSAKTHIKKSCLWEIHRRVMEHHLPYQIAQCYLPPDAGERTCLNPSQVLNLPTPEG